MSSSESYPQPTAERAAEIKESLEEIRERVGNAFTAANGSSPPTLVAVSKIKPASDIMAAYNVGHRDFGESYINELVDKASILPPGIRWHFIGTLQSNKAKVLASVSNLHTLQTLTSSKSATILNGGLPESRTSPLNVMIQVNTSGEDSKSGLSPSIEPHSDSEVILLARHILDTCPRLHLLGLMTIGSWDESHSADGKNKDFECLLQVREQLEQVLRERKEDSWGRDGRLLCSMGMSADFEEALKAGSGVVRVGSSIFGEREKKQ